MADRLRSCPFCGEDAEVNYCQCGTIAYVRCSGCGIYSPHFDAKSDAIEFWNARIKGDEEEGGER